MRFICIIEDRNIKISVFDMFNDMDVFYKNSIVYFWRCRYNECVLYGFINIVFLIFDDRKVGNRYFFWDDYDREG